MFQRLRRDDACRPRHQYPELRECGRNYQSDRCVDLGCQRDGWRSSAMSQQEGNTSENQRAEMLDSLFTSLELVS
jgi:hypothetical protein